MNVKTQSMSQRTATLLAVATSVLVLSATFGFASLLRARESVAAHGRFAVIAPPVPASPLSADAEQGRHLFLMNCAHCHGDDARGDEGPDLHGLRKSNERIHQIITAGIKGEMPSFAKKLNDSDIQALTTYLRTLHG